MTIGQSAMTCQELVTLVTDYFEGALPPERRRLFEAHVRGCEGCARYVEQLRETLRITGRLAEADVAPEARDRLLEVFRAWKRSTDA